MRFRGRSSRALVLAALGCALGPSAHAVWTATGGHEIEIFQGGVITSVPVGSIDCNDDVVSVRVGDDAPVPLTGSVTVFQETIPWGCDFGNWHIVNGAGVVESSFGYGSFHIGSGPLQHHLDGSLDVIDSNLYGAYITVDHGILRVHPGSRVRGIGVSEFGTAEIQPGAFALALGTKGGLAIATGAVVGSIDQFCWWQGGIVRADDSIVRCQDLAVKYGADAEIGLSGLGNPRLEVTLRAEVEAADLTVRDTTVITSSLELRPGSSVDVSGGSWSNAGALNFFAVAGPLSTMRLDEGAKFHGHEAHVAGHLGTEHLVVTGADTLVDLNGDLHVGSYLLDEGVEQDYTGTLTVADGATIVVDGTLYVGAQAIVNLEPGGTIYAAALDDQGGVINQNGGALHVPEPDPAAIGITALGLLAMLGGPRRSDRRRVR